jgi:TolA-binding protein
MSFTIPEFESWASANTRLVMKMLKVFSNQMRRIHGQLSNIIKEDQEQEAPEAGLFRVGEFYLKNKRFSQARYIFSRYLTYYPSGEDAVQASKFLAFAEGVPESRPKPQIETPSPAKTFSKTDDTPEEYYSGLSLVAQQNYEKAFQIFKKIVDKNTDEEYTAKSIFEIGRCFFLMGKYETGVKHFTQMIAKYPKHPELGDALFYIGQCHEKCGHTAVAATVYKKIISLETDEGTRLKAKKALNKLER